MTATQPRRCPLRRRLTAALSAVTLTAGTLAGLTATAATSTAAAPSWECDNGVGARYPILLVHGFTSSAATWTTKTREYLASDTAHTCVTTFDYAPYATNWVTDPHIGPALAQRIVSLADSSAAAGGPGKVIVVGHSMGGLATRCAADASCNGGIDGVAGRLADVITYGTPNLGTWLKGYGRSDLADVLGPYFSFAGGCYEPQPQSIMTGICKFIQGFGTSAAAAAFTPGSHQLKELPHLPSTVPVYAVAGSLKVTTTWFGRFTKTLGDVGDLVVSENSALADANTVDGLGGKATVDCGVIDLTADYGGFRCWHGLETSATEFQTDALVQIHKVVSVGLTLATGTYHWVLSDCGNLTVSAGTVAVALEGDHTQCGKAVAIVAHHYANPHTDPVHSGTREGNNWFCSTQQPYTGSAPAKQSGVCSYVVDDNASDEDGIFWSPAVQPSGTAASCAASVIAHTLAGAGIRGTLHAHTCDRGYAWASVIAPGESTDTTTEVDLTSTGGQWHVDAGSPNDNDVRAVPAFLATEFSILQENAPIIPNENVPLS